MLKTAVEKLVRGFTTNPANFTVEAELASHLKQQINENETEIHAKGHHDSGTAQGVRDHSEYADRICAPTKIQPAHCEVNVRDLSAPKTVRLIDLAVFQDDLQFELSDGTKRFSSGDIRAAAELKFVKNRKYLRPNSDKFEQIEKDIFRLNQLSDADERFALIFGNFDLTRKRPGQQALDDLATISGDVSVLHAYPKGVSDPGNSIAGI